ncbi:MAG TPA: LysM peptidoglycan-binding domain-containing protein [Anaerolineae bacterium]|nr:LysM peptidoglycan-binding domain-containing protein [Anaerolineae bacterium]
MNARDVPQPLQGLLISVIMLGTLLGGFILAANDRSLNPIGVPDPIGTRVAVVARTPIGTPVTPPDFATSTALTPTEWTPTPSASEAMTQTAPPIATPTPICPAPPANWMRIAYSQSEATLTMIALRYNTTFERLFEVNCLDKVLLQALPWLYVPALSPVLAPPAPPPVLNCFVPQGWPVYRVQWGDTLSNLAARFNISVVMLMRYNCLNSSLIYQGQLLNVPYALPAPRATLTPLPTWTPGWTPTPWLTVTLTDTPTPSPTPSPVPTDTPEPPITPTVEVPTDTPTPASTPVPTDTPEPPMTPTVEVPTEAPPTFTPPTVTPPTFTPPTVTPVPPTQPQPVSPRVTPGLP